MVKVNLKGVTKVKSKGKDYWYAWRGGPRLQGKPGSPEFNASYNDAIASLSATDDCKFQAVVTAYKASTDFNKLADSTKRNWSRCLDDIADYFGPLRVAQFNRPDSKTTEVQKSPRLFAIVGRKNPSARQLRSISWLVKG